MSELALFGGSRVRDTTFNRKHAYGPAEEEAAVRVVRSGNMSGFVGASGKFFNGGPEVTGFEDAFKRFGGYPHAVTTNSWTTGLQTIIGAIGIEPGDEILCPPYTMSASATTALFYGGIPVFVDIEPHRFAIDPDKIEEKITPRTKAIVVVHLFGYPAAMDPILALAEKHGLYVIEDAAQAPGVKYKGRDVGCLGTIGGFSLNYHKHIHCGEGGIIVTRDDRLADRCRAIRNHGENLVTDDWSVEDVSNIIGSNYRLTEIQAAIAAAQLDRLPGYLESRDVLGRRLIDKLAHVDFLACPDLSEEGSTHAFYMFPMRFDQDIAGIPRNLFLRAVNAELPDPISWDTLPLAEGYVKPLYINKVYEDRIAIGTKHFPFNLAPQGQTYREGMCPVVEKLYNDEMLLTPLVHEATTEADLNDFVAAIDKVIENLPALRDHWHKDSANQVTKVFDTATAIDTHEN